MQGTLSVVDIAAPRPAQGQLVLDVRSCGICGSDLHAKDHADELAEVFDETGYPDGMRSTTPTVMGHEFSGEVAERGAGTPKALKVGTRVVSFPMVRAHGGVHLTGLSPLAPGGYAEQVLVEAAMTFPVPNGLSMDVAALTEPMAVALHAVRRSEVTKRDTAIVIGCGPVGLAVICQLKARGVATIVASDFSRGGARWPASAAPISSSTRRSTRPTPGRLARAWSPTSRAGRARRRIDGEAAQATGLAVRLPGGRRPGAAGPKRPVIFECVGVPGMIDGVIAAAPLTSRVIVVGVCMGTDQIRPTMAIGKEIDLRFVFGYTPLEFRDTLHMLADGKLNASPLITGKVGLDGVSAAFEALGDPESHAKILVDPRSMATAP